MLSPSYEKQFSLGELMSLFGRMLKCVRLNDLIHIVLHLTDFTEIISLQFCVDIDVCSDQNKMAVFPVELI